MKRFSKMLALGLAAVLVFGMTAQAAGSTDADNSTVEAETLKENAGVENKVVVDGKEVEVEFSAPTKLGDEQMVTVKTTVANEAVVNAVTEAAKKNVPDAANVTLGKPEVKAAFNLEAPKGLTDAQIKAGVQIPFTLKDIKTDGSVVYTVLHYFADGSYEVLPASVKNGKIYATFTSFSPVVILAQTVTKATTNQPAAQTPSTGDTQTPAPAVAPKTGETAPVAGIMALVLMAGAVICAKKVRYNR